MNPIIVTEKNKGCTLEPLKGKPLLPNYIVLAFNHLLAA
jgi:hypothetical protein